MSAINNLYKKEKLNNVEELIARVSNYAWEEMTLQEQGELREQAARELAALLAAGNEMAERLRAINEYVTASATEDASVKLYAPNNAAALTIWEEVTK
jgi:hypothetical protein